MTPEHTKPYVFIPAAVSRCPHCHSRVSGAVKRLLLAGGGAVTLTLMACYGVAYHHQEMVAADDHRETGCASQGDDIDKDGWCSPHDCDEVNAALNPDAPDSEGDGIDQNCDGQDGMAQDTIAASD